MRKNLLAVFIFILSFLWINQASIFANEEPEASTSVYVIPVENEVERGLVAFLERSIKEAEKHLPIKSYLKLIHQAEE